MSDTGLAYLAGFFDGEGCVYINRSKFKGYVKHTIRIAVGNTSVRPLVMFAQRFGGSVLSQNRKTHTLPIFSWGIQSRKAYLALKELLPFLVVKREEAELAIQFYETCIDKFPRAFGVPVENLAERERLRFAIREVRKVVRAERVHA